MRTRIFLTLMLLRTAVVAAQDPQGGFVPVTEVPPGEQLPSLPLVIGAYAFVWAAFLFYAWTMWKKLGKVEQEITTLSAQISRSRAKP